MRIREFISEQRFAQPRDQMFEFFGDAANLNAITPPWINFRTITPEPIDMRAGALIDYKLRIRGFPMRWRTRIAVWEPPVRFVDEQLRGPYRLWVHEHSFEPCDRGTLMRDRIRYAVPFDWLVHRWLVQPEIERIFAYRTEMLRQHFATAANGASA